MKARGRLAHYKLLCLLGLAVAARAGTLVPAIVSAAKSGDVTAVRASLASVNSSEPDGTTALHWAARAGNLTIVQLLIEAKANVNAANRYGVTPLSLAVSAGNAPLVAMLLRAGADAKRAEASLPDGQRLLMLAARTGNVETIRALAGQLDVNAIEPRTGTTALMWAALEDRAFAVKALLQLGASVNARSTLTQWPHTPPAIIGDALEEGQSYIGQSQLPKGGWTALMYAAREGALDAAMALAEAGADLNITDPYGTSALGYAIINAHWDMAKALVDKGAGVNLADTTGMTPLYAAVDMHTLANTFGRPDLARHAMDGAADVIAYLLAHGADPNSRLKTRVHKRVYNPGDARLGEGSTPLMRAARGGDARVARMLLAAGADAKLSQKSKVNAVMLAAAVRGIAGNHNLDVGTEASAAEVIKLCLDRGVDVDEASEAGDTAVHAAVGSPTLIRLLAGRGARLDLKNRKGQTPLDAALAREPGDATVQLLRELVPRPYE